MFRREEASAELFVRSNGREKSRKVQPFQAASPKQANYCQSNTANGSHWRDRAARWNDLHISALARATADAAAARFDWRRKPAARIPCGAGDASGAQIASRRPRMSRHANIWVAGARGRALGALGALGSSCTPARRQRTPLALFLSPSLCLSTGRRTLIGSALSKRSGERAGERRSSIVFAP